MRTKTFDCLVFLVAAALCGCNKSKNYPTARYVEIGEKYAVTFSGLRMLMAHDPISALQDKTYETSDTIILPRITGRVEGSEIPTKPGHYLLGGFINISGDSMEVRLFAHNTDDHTKDQFSWNGEYTLAK